MSRRFRAGCVLSAVLVAACGTTPSMPPPAESAATDAPGTDAPSQPSATAGAAPGSTALPTIDAGPADLSARPLVWLAPLPPMPTGPGRPYTGSDDFMTLFTEDAAWERAAGHLGVFKLYGEWVAYHASDAQLRAAVTDIARRGLVLAVEMGPLDPPPGCGEGVEGFAGLDEAALITNRIREAGGVLQVVALDEPWYFATVYEGPNACRWSVEETAAAVAGFTRAMRQSWPGIIVGDTEPTPAPVTVAGLTDWLRAYEAAAGAPFGFLHLDLDWSRSDWVDMARNAAAASTAQGVPFGIIYNGGAATEDAIWLSIAGRRVLEYAATSAGDPEHVVFQSWMDKPDRALPETEPLSFTALVNRFFDDRAALSVLIGGTTNRALGRPTSASSSVPDGRPGNAVDGIADTIWSAGVGPPAFIDIDLGEPTSIARIRLLVAQSPPGSTDHRVLCRRTAGAALEPLGRLQGATADLDQLMLDLSPPVTCRIIRIRTVASPSWVAWREIEVYSP